MIVLVDTNILLDYILRREPFWQDARLVVNYCVKKRFIGCIAAHSIPNIFYILRKEFSIEDRRQLLLGICQLFHVEGIDQVKVESALSNTNFDDFEDCLQMECAKAFYADYIVTRNPKDFVESEIPYIEPRQLLELIE